MSRPVAVVTGGSRGVGADTCRELARSGCDVAFTYRDKAKRADEVSRELRAAGAEARAIRADITVPAAVDALAAELRVWRGRVDVLVLNASGGLERDLLAAQPDYPMRINRDAQLLVVDRLLPMMPPGGTIVFVTSHWAHRYGDVDQLPSYEPIARSKHAGELALRGRLGELASAGVRLVVVTGDLIEGTITARLLERSAPGLAARRGDEIGALPSTAEMARAIVAAALDSTLDSGHTVVVGGALEAIPPRG